MHVAKKHQGANRLSFSQEENGQPRILIIGAGMSGILATVKLREAGYHNITMFEKASSLGGVWRDNTYPGLKCDVPAPMFTYSFAPNPEYSTRFPRGNEILAYLQKVFCEFDVGRHAVFNKSVESLTYDDGRWYSQTVDSEIEEFDIVVCATGILRDPHLPDIKGLQSFGGISFHTARWNHSVDLKDKRIGVIGTGSTAAQVVTELVHGGSQVTLFQRTPQWVFPMPNRLYSESEKEKLRQSPKLSSRLRARYSKFFQYTFARAVIGNSFLQYAIEAVCRSHLHRRVKDNALRDKLTPQYRAGCKRLIFAKNFYRALQKPNATLEISPISSIEPEGVRTEDGVLHPLDVIVYATGFNAHQFMRPMQVVGRGKQTIEEVWKDGAFAHRSTSIPGFPNFFMILGPYSPIGNFSAISVAEVQVKFILQQLQLLKETGNDLIEADGPTTKNLIEQMDKAMGRTVWMSGCSSWYISEQGRAPMWPWTFERYEREMARIRPSEFCLARRPVRSMYENPDPVLRPIPRALNRSGQAQPFTAE